MHSFLSTSRRRIARCVRSEEGSISVEAVLWMPVYVFFIALIVDTSMMLHSRSVALRIIEDANRHAVIGYLVDGSEVSQRVSEQVQLISSNATVNVDWGTNDIETVVRMPASDLQALGLLSVMANLEITVSSFNRFEL